jgi:hypothetical protein
VDSIDSWEIVRKDLPTRTLSLCEADEMIREYLEKQNKHPNHHNDNFRVG